MKVGTMQGQGRVQKVQCWDEGLIKVLNVLLKRQVTDSKGAYWPIGNSGTFAGRKVKEHLKGMTLQVAEGQPSTITPLAQSFDIFHPLRQKWTKVGSAEEVGGKC